MRTILSHHLTPGNSTLIGLALATTAFVALVFSESLLATAPVGITIQVAVGLLMLWARLAFGRVPTICRARPLSTMIILSFVSLLFFAPSTAQQKREMTVEWTLGDTAAWVSTPPSSTWLADGTILLLDTQKPPRERAFEILDAGSGRRQPAFDMKKALASLKTFLPEDSSSSLSWPLSIDAAGRRAVYLFSGDVMVLEITEGKFTRITNSPSEEKAASISPNGQRVAFVRDNDVYVYDLGLSRETRITHDGNDSLLNGVFSWVYWEEIFGHREAATWWSPDSRSVAFLRTDESSVRTMYFTDFQPYQPTVYRQRYPKAGQRNPSVKLGIADAATGATVWIQLPLSCEYIVRVNWIPGSERIAVQTMNRAQTEVILFLVDCSTGMRSELLKESDDAWMHHYEPLFSKDGKHLIWISERSGYAHAYRYSMSGEFINQITHGEWSLSPFGGYAAGSETPLKALEEKNGYLFFTAKEKSSLEEQLYRVRLDGTEFKRISRRNGNHHPEFSPDGSLYLDEQSSASVPPALLLCRSDGTELQSVSTSRNDLVAPFAMQFPAFFTIPAGDGFHLPAQISKPSNFNPAKKYPVIVYVYGGPGSASVRNRWNANGWSESIFFDQMLLAQGYLILSVDNRSSATIGKRYEKSIRGQMYGAVELQDLEAAVRWLKARSYVDPDRIGIWGWSGGGMYTLLALTRTKEFKAGIAVAPVTDWHYYDTKFTELWMKRPEDNPDGYEKTSLVKVAADLHGRLFLIHGTYDDNVHPQNSQAFMDELIKARILFDFLVYPMRKHIIGDFPARVHLYTMMLEFWKKNL